jgi:hypothetical protein
MSKVETKEHPKPTKNIEPRRYPNGGKESNKSRQANPVRRQ